MRPQRDRVKVNRVPIERRMLRRLSPHVFVGISVSKGVAIGKCILLKSEEKRGEGEGTFTTEKISSSVDEADRFVSAVERVKQELQSV